MTLPEIWSVLQLVAVVIVGGCFLLSGIAKVRDSSNTENTFTALGVPSFLNRAWIRSLYPRAELLIGLGVLFSPVAWWAFAIFAFVALLALTVLVSRLVLRAESVECNCFGTSEAITGRTLARNLLFLSFAILLLVPPAIIHSTPIFSGPPAMSVAVALSAAAAAAAAVLSRGPASAPATHEDSDLFLPSELFVSDGEGRPAPLQSILDGTPLLLVHVRHGCSACSQIAAHLQDGQYVADRVKVRFVESSPQGLPLHDKSRLWDHGGVVTKALGMSATPTALLIAADGLIPADPVVGYDEIMKLVAGIEQAVSSGGTSR